MGEKGQFQKILLQIDAISDCGCVRHRNEDMALVGNRPARDEDFSVFVELSASDCFVVSIADGMGGQQGGDVASERVTDGLRRYVSSLDSGLGIEELRTSLSACLQKLHTELCEEGEQQPHLWGMGTTLTGLLVYGGGFYSFHAGDSRIYRLRDGIVRQLTVDHTVRNKTGNSAISSHALYNSIGGGQEMFVDIEVITSMVFTDDLFLICSDGLYDMLSTTEIEQVLSTSSPAGQLVKEAKAAGGNDNISLALVRITGLLTE